MQLRVCKYGLDSHRQANNIPVASVHVCTLHVLAICLELRKLHFQQEQTGCVCAIQEHSSCRYAGDVAAPVQHPGLRQVTSVL